MKITNSHFNNSRSSPLNHRISTSYKKFLQKYFLHMYQKNKVNSCVHFMQY